MYSRITEVFSNKPHRKLEGPFATGRGHPLPFGSTITEKGVNFAIFSKNATTVTLVLFRPQEEAPFYQIDLDPRFNKTGDIWHVEVFELSAEAQYGYQIDGLYQPERGHRYDRRVVLLDPYAQELSGGKIWGETGARSRRCCIAAHQQFDWQGDYPHTIEMQDSVIYELHVRGFTKSPSANVQSPGTFHGIIEKIPYLKELGITAVELMPICEFDENENHYHDPTTGQRLKNFWGYSSLAFFAPKASYAASQDKDGHTDEFKKMVRHLHEAGIEVILDVVFNHTAEGNEAGPTLSFKGIDNSIYYMLDNEGRYRNFSGCGNTINCNHPLIRDFILDCLHYWVTEMHIDGFRFDLASILGRAEDGSVLENPPIIERIARDPVLAKTKIIAEAWDAAGLYQVGSFPACGRWAEWNGRFRDVVRSFVKGDEGRTWQLAQCLMGSPDLYEVNGRHPYHSVNYITCHDGFTLYDLVSYNYKHNHQNGEQNRDGTNENYSWNCGHEGPTTVPKIVQLRKRQIKNMVTILFLSQGVPMILAGDEFLRTQSGNNNAYCQDNKISWIDWSLADDNQDMLRFFRKIIAFRKRHPVLRQKQFFPKKGDHYLGITWHGTKPGKPDFGHYSRTLAFSLDGSYATPDDTDIYSAINSFWEPLRFTLPRPPAQKKWYRVIDTSRPSPEDIVEDGKGRKIDDNFYFVPARCVVVLIAR